MSASVSELKAAPPEGPPPRRRWLRVVVGVSIALAASLALVIGLVIVPGVSRYEPTFSSLSEHPDGSLQGTVAYFADRSRCVRIVAAAGQPSKDVLCLPEMDISKAEKAGKEIGPQLVWLADGRLEVTMFRLPLTPGPGLNAGWQKIVDVRTGKVEDVPAAEVPAAPNLRTQPTASPNGERISWTSNETSGRVKVVLDSDTGSRTLLSVQGTPNYTYRLSSAFWAPNWQWIAADDGRILVITTGQPSVTRVLTDETRQLQESEFPRFAVTATNFLTPSS